VEQDYLVRRYAKPVVFLACALPAAWLALGILALQSGDGTSPAARALGANPVEAVQDTLGIWGLRLLLVTLAVTPLRVLMGWPRLQLFRRMLGLFAFFYVTLHFVWYLFVDQTFDWAQLAGDVVKRPYITAGFTALLLLVPLAATSTRRAMRRLGRRWQKLHRLVYAAAILGCVHYWWQVKADIREPLVYAAILAALLGWRLWHRRQRRSAPATSTPRPGGERRERDAREDQASARAGSPVERLAEQPPAQQ
jgi:methionine sulfoxide reductase heme-binding subunit